MKMFSSPRAPRTCLLTYSRPSNGPRRIAGARPLPRLELYNVVTDELHRITGSSSFSMFFESVYLVIQVSDSNEQQRILVSANRPRHAWYLIARAPHALGCAHMHASSITFEERGRTGSKENITEACQLLLKHYTSCRVLTDTPEWYIVGGISLVFVFFDFPCGPCQGICRH